MISKFSKLGIATFALLVTSLSAEAADIPVKGYYKAQPRSVISYYNWTGGYIGINGGYGWGNSNWDGFANEPNVHGGLVGATLGTNWQAGALVFGAEGDIDWSNLRGSFASVACPAGCETRNNWLATVRGRVGYALDRWMPYATGGLAVGDIEANRALLGGVKETNVGWTAGGGVEAAVVGNLTAKLEYLYVDLGSVNCSTLSCGLPTDVDLRSNLVRGGVNLRF
jgi:outer membrane immunogenic protein